MSEMVTLLLPRAGKSGIQTFLPAPVKDFPVNELTLLFSTSLLTRWLERNQPGVVQETQALESDKQGRIPLLLLQGVMF